MGNNSSFANWQFASQNVQAEIGNGRYVSSESTLLLGGPSRLKHISGDTAIDALRAQASLVPIGIVQNFSSAQSRGVQRLFEVGSKLAYFVTGRTFGNFNLSRVLFYGPSLMRMLYGAAPFADLGFGQPFKFDNQTPSTPTDYAALFGATAEQRQLNSAPGFGAPSSSTEGNRDFFINLASELFSVPFGLCVVLKDAKGRPYGASYLEDCYLESHTMGIDSGNIVIAEAVSGQFGVNAPIQLITRV